MGLGGPFFQPFFEPFFAETEAKNGNIGKGGEGDWRLRLDARAWGSVRDSGSWDVCCERSVGSWDGSFWLASLFEI
jgi:hypothetical protein